MDCLYPGTFPYSRVKWGAKHEHEFVDNYKILQAAFDKNGIKRHIDVAKLVKAKYQDNLEFCQWIKAYFEKHYNGEPYDGPARRKHQELYYIAGGNKVNPNNMKQPVSSH
jgi:microtubule-associated protein, RP/EB family